AGRTLRRLWQSSGRRPILGQRALADGRRWFLRLARANQPGRERRRFIQLGFFPAFRGPYQARGNTWQSQRQLFRQSPAGDLESEVCAGESFARSANGRRGGRERRGRSGSGESAVPSGWSRL